jgi:hypothetical protein
MKFETHHSPHVFFTAKSALFEATLFYFRTSFQGQAKLLPPKAKKRVPRIEQIRALDVYGSDSAQKRHLLINAKNSDGDIARVGVCHYDHDIKRQ